jgi:hypothetical protein
LILLCNGCCGDSILHESSMGFSLSVALHITIRHLEKRLRVLFLPILQRLLSRLVIRLALSL